MDKIFTTETNLPSYNFDVPYEPPELFDYSFEPDARYVADPEMFTLPAPTRSLGVSVSSHTAMHSNEGTFVETYPWYGEQQSQPQYTSSVQRKVSRSTDYREEYRETSASKTIYKPPPVPEFALSKTHFSLEFNSANQLLELLNLILDDQTSYGLQFEANFEKCEFTCYYIVGSKHCKFMLSVYDNSATKKDSFLVEAQKRNGDSAPFRSIFETIKVCCMTSPSLTIGVRESFSNSIPTPCKSCWDAESVEGLIPILNMARSRMIDTQLEGARLLCEISSDDACHEFLCANGVVDIMKAIIEDTQSIEWAKQHAVLALVNMCDQINCQEAIIKAGVLPVLLRLATDGPCQSAELRRLSVVILAKISSRVAEKVIAHIDSSDLRKWMGAVDSLKDKKIKLQAEIVRTAFRSIVTGS